MVRRPQSQSVSSKAAGCGGQWAANPTTACGLATQSPAQNASNVSLTPNFHWDYSDTPDGQCHDPAGCATYAASVYLFEGSMNTPALARCDTPAQSTPVKDCPFANVKTCIPGDPNCHTDGQPHLTALKPSTTYWWRVTPYFGGIVHAEQTWNYVFTTGAAITTPTCNSITLTPNTPAITLSSLARQVTAAASGGDGNFTYTFALSNTGGAGNGTLTQTTTGAATAVWTAPDLSNTQTNQTWTITATAKDGGGRQSTTGNCTVTLTYTPQLAGAACQQVVADKTLTTLKIGDTVTFTGYGSLGTDQGDSIDQIEFTFRKDNAVISTDTVATTRDTSKDAGNLKYWKAVKSYTISQPGSYSVTIRVHWKNQNVWKG